MAATARFIDMNGYLLVKGCPVSTFGVFDYSAAQCGETEDDNHGDINRVVKVYRPEAAVSDPQFIDSLKLVPMIDEHDYLTGDPTEMQAAGETPGLDPSEKGVDGIMTDQVYYEAPWLRSDLKIFSRKLMVSMREGKTDLSLGYLGEFEYAPGEYMGQPYEYIQTNMRGNHIALVGAGRVPGARVLDGRLVFDSLTFNLPSATNMKESEMDETEKAQLMSSLDALAASCAPAPAAKDPAMAAKDENEVVHNEHEREAGAEIGVDDVIAKLEETAKRLRESAGAKAEEAAAAAPVADEGGDNEVVADEGEDDEKSKEKTGDDVDGLREGKGAEIATDDEAGSDKVVKAAKGPAAGVQSVGDAALRTFHADVATRNRLAARAKPLVGVFDHSRLTATDTAVYVAGRLKIKVDRKTAVATMDALLAGFDLGVKHGAKQAPASAANGTRVGDSAQPEKSDVISAYLKPRT